MRPAVALALLLVGLLLDPIDASAASGGAVHVRRHMRRDGTYVQPHYRSAPSRTKMESSSTRANVNPQSGRAGPPGAHPNFGEGGRGSASGATFVDPHLVPSDAPRPSFRAPAGAVSQRRVTSNAAPAAAPRSEPGIQVIEGGSVYDERKADLDYQRFHAAKGNPESQYAMGMRHLKGIGVPQNEEAGIEYLRAADRNGHLKARAKLSELSSERRRKREEEAALADEKFARQRDSQSEK